MVFKFDNHVLDIERRELRRGAQPVPLEPQVFDLLVYLVHNRTRVVSKDDLINGVWGGRAVSDSALTTRLNAARRAVNDSGAAQRIIRTVARKGVRFVAETEEDNVRAAAKTEPEPSTAFSDDPSIAVLPFANLSADPEQENFVDGLAEEIITALSRIRWLVVVARNSSFTYRGRTVDVKQLGRELGVRYVLGGSVRKVGDRVRITVQLINARNGAHLWADRFDGSLADVFELQDSVANSVTGAIEPALQAAEAARSAGRPAGDLGAYDCYARALMTFNPMTKEAVIEALGLLDRAIGLDRHYGPALALAAACNMQLVNYGWAADPETPCRNAVDLARRALQLAFDDPNAIAGAAMVLGVFGEDIGTMTALVDHALALNPSFARGWYNSAFLRLMAGTPDRAIELAEVAVRLSPRTRTGAVYTVIGSAHFLSRRFDEAIPKLLLALEETPNFPVPYRYLAACYAHLQRLNDARAIIKRLRALTPAVTPPRMMYLRNAEHRQLYQSGLELAAAEATI